MPQPGIYKTNAVTIEGPSLGLVKSLPQHLIDDRAFTDCHNMAFAGGECYLEEGWAKAMASRPDTSRAFLMMQYFDTPEKAEEPLIVATANHVKRYNALTDTWVSITPAGYAPSPDRGPPNRFDAFNDLLIFSAGRRTPVYKIYKPGGVFTCAPLGGLSDINIEMAMVVRCYAYHVLLAFVQDDGTLHEQRIVWSDLNLPEMWIPGLVDPATGQTSEAGYLDIYTQDKYHATNIDAIELMRDLAYVYTESSICALQFVGYPLVFIFRVVNPIIGAQYGSVCNFGDKHVFISHDWNFYLFNGVDVQNIGIPIRDYLLTRIPFERGFHGPIRCQTLRNPDRARFYYPVKPAGSLDPPSEHLTYNLENGTWSKGDYPFTSSMWARSSALQAVSGGDDSWNSAVGSWNAQTRIWDSTDGNDVTLRLNWYEMMGDANGYIYKRQGWTKADLPYTGYAETKLFDAGDPRNAKMLIGFHASVSKLPQAYVVDNVPLATAYTIQVWVAAKMSYNEVDSWEGPYTVTITPTGYGDEVIDLRRTARFFKFKFQTVSEAASAGPPVTGSKPFALKWYAWFFKARGPR